MKKVSRAINFLIITALALTVGAAAIFPGFRLMLQNKIRPVSVAIRSAVSEMESLIAGLSRGTSSAGSSTPLSSEVGVSGFPKSDGQAVRKIPSPQDEIGQVKSIAITSGAAATGKYSVLKPDSCYQSLNSGAARQIYRMISQNVCQVAVQKSSSGYYPIQTLSYNGDASEAQIRLAMIAYLDDNPQTFWLADVYGFSTQYGATKIQLYSVLSPDDCLTAEKKLDSTVSSVLRSMPSGLSEFDREEYLFQYLVDRCSYDNAAVSDTSRWQAFTAYGAIADGSAVCEGYSRAMQLLSVDSGLNCILVSGNSGGSGHMWNQIKIGGAWYHLDVTWCDNSILIYNYFNVIDNVIAQTHQIGSLASALSDHTIEDGSAQFNFTLHGCSSTAANYFQCRGIPVSADTSSSDQSVINALVPVLKEGKTSVAFLVQGSYDSTVQKMVSGGKLASWFSRAAKAAGRSLNTGALKYVTDSADSGVTVAVSYR